MRCLDCRDTVDQGREYTPRGLVRHRQLFHAAEVPAQARKRSARAKQAKTRMLRASQDAYRQRLRDAGLCLDGCGAAVARGGLCAEHYAIKKRREIKGVRRCSACGTLGHIASNLDCPARGR